MKTGILLLGASALLAFTAVLVALLVMGARFSKKPTQWPATVTHLQ